MFLSANKKNAIEYYFEVQNIIEVCFQEKGCGMFSTRESAK